MKKINIKPRENSSITKEINIDLGTYTIFAGENNAGKTNLMEALRECLPKEQTIYIPAESILAQDHLKTTAKEDPMRDAFSKLITISLEQLPDVNYESIETFLGKISDTFDSFDVKNIELELSVKKLKEEDVKKILKDEISKKILNSAIKDSYGPGYNLAIEDVGQGTQRLIIAAILQEVSKAKAQNEELFLIFEEPEIYLHPKLKRSLYNSLLNISKNNINVILTTHDPYFIELGIDQAIRNVTRDEAGATEIKPFVENILEYSSHAEINYIIFNIPTTDYFLQLYQMAKERDMKDFEKQVIDNISIFDIRSCLAHKTNSAGQKSKKQPLITEDTKKKSIEYLRKILK